jgi:peptidylprolyl isomerase
VVEEGMNVVNLIEQNDYIKKVIIIRKGGLQRSLMLPKHFTIISQSNLKIKEETSC